MSRTAPTVTISDDDRRQLTTWANGASTAYRLVQRAHIVLMAATGARDIDIARQLRTSRPTVHLWRKRYLAFGLKGIEKDQTRPGRKVALTAAQIKSVVDRTLHTKPPNATHWSIRTMSGATGHSRMAIQRIWSAHNLKPHLVETFKLSRDKRFVEKLKDVVGLYMNPPENALVLSFDEKSQIQALDRSQPILPLRPGIPERQTHDYKRHGTTTLFTALNILDGTVIAKCSSRHRHQEFIKFLNQIDRETPADLGIHLIADNYATHKHEQVKNWLKRHKRFQIHFIPTSSSWLNLVERWFREITTKRIRRGSFQSVEQLIQAIEEYVAHNNANPKPFVWTATADKILAKIAKCKEALGTLH
ncbi:MAG: IS630 family transposase [Bryobacteraceae bacterium]